MSVLAASSLNSSRWFVLLVVAADVAGLPSFGFDLIELGEDSSQLCEVSFADPARPLPLQASRRGLDQPFDFPPALGEPELDPSSIVGGRHAVEVTAALEGDQEVVHRLLGHVRAGGELARTHAVRSWRLEDVDVRHREVGEPGSAQLLDPLLADGEVDAPDQRRDVRLRVH